MKRIDIGPGIGSPQRFSAVRRLENRKAVLYACLVLAVSLWSCDSKDLEYFPWFSSYTEQRVELDEYFVREYQDVPVLVRTLYDGDQRIRLAYQNRSPSAPPILLLLDEDLAVLHVLEDVRLSDPRHWYISPDGNIRLGHVMLVPESADGPWTAEENEHVPYLDAPSVRITVADFVYDLRFAIDGDGSLVLPFNDIAGTETIPYQEAMRFFDSNLTELDPIPAPSDKILISGFMGDYVDELFPPSDIYPPPGGIYNNVTMLTAWVEGDALHATFHFNNPNAGRNSKHISVVLPAEVLQDLPDDITSDVTFRVLNDDEMLTTDTYGEDPVWQRAVDTGDDVIVFRMSALHRELEDQRSFPYMIAYLPSSPTPRLFRLPSFDDEPGSTRPLPAYPQYQDGDSSWFVWDARTSQLFQNVPWWRGTP